jgi:hypothetical protein
MSTLLVPDVRRILNDLARRVGILERRVTDAGTAAATGTDEIIFSHAGALTETESPPVRIRQGGILAVLAVSFGTAGSTDTTLTVNRNGTAVATVTVPDGVTIYNDDIGARFASDSDTLSIEVTSAGSDAADMTAAARFI